MASVPLLRLSVPPPKTLTPKSYHQSNLIPPLPHRLRSTLPVPLLRRSSSSSSPRTTFIVSASHNSTPVTDRLISAIAYFLPFFNGLQYGRFLFAQYPRTLGAALDPILPLLGLYRSVPFASYVAFLVLYAGVVRNSNFSNYVRFNAMQAVVLDVLLAVPLLIQQIVAPHPRGFGLKALAMSHSALFVVIAVCFVYSLVYSVLGRTPYLPFVADAAGRQM